MPSTPLFDANLVGNVADAMGSPATFTRDGVPASPTRRQTLRIWAISDIHIRETNDSTDQPIAKFNRAIQDANAQGCELAILNGDVTQEGYAHEYAQLANCLTNLDMPYEATTGNHEFLGADSESAQRQRFMDQFGYTGTPYGFHIRNGVLLVRLCTELANANAGYFRSAQLTWLANLLAAHRTKTTLIFMHHPLRNTVARSDIFPNFLEQTSQLRSILAGHPQVKLVITGHTHQQMTDTPQWLTDSSGVQLAGGSSTAYRREYSPDGTSSTKTYTMEQSPFVEVYGDRVVVRGRRHEVGAQGWVSHHTLTTPTTYTAPIVIGPVGEVLRYNVTTPSTFTFAGKYMPRFGTSTGRTVSATLLHARDACSIASRTLEYRPAQRIFRFTDGIVHLESTPQQFRTNEPIFFAVQQHGTGQRFMLRIGDRGQLQHFVNSQVTLLAGITELYLGNTPGGMTGMDGWCALRLWDGALSDADILTEWGQMAAL